MSDCDKFDEIINSIKDHPQKELRDFLYNHILSCSESHTDLTNTEDEHQRFKLGIIIILSGEGTILCRDTKATTFSGGHIHDCSDCREWLRSDPELQSIEIILGQRTWPRDDLADSEELGDEPTIISFTEINSD